jgi:hypothetical protein
MSRNAVDVLRDVAAILDSLGIRYVVGGSMASSVHGEARYTRDADIVVDLAPNRVEPLAEALEPRFYVSRDAMREAVRARDCFNAIEPESGFKVDFFVVGRTAFDAEELRRGIREPSPPTGRPGLVYKTPEDIVLRKLLWYRSGGEASDRQWHDVLGVLATCRGRLDEAYLDRWAADLGVADLLAKARAASGP